ncbi:MAG: RluA family pseudouridine synthase [Bacteroidota bacterium]
MTFEDQFKKVESYKVPTLEKEVRLSDFTPGIFKTIRSKKGIKNAIKKGLVTVNGEIGYTADYIRGEEIIELYQSKFQENKPSINLNIEVVFEDDYLAIVTKPAGMVVSGNKKWTLENALPTNLKESIKKDALHRPEPIHRLDYPTSGVLLVGKTTQAVMALNKLFEERKIEKIYYAVTIGLIEDSGIINTKIENKTAKTEFEILSRLSSPKYKFLNLTKLKPHTGRRHQLRIHMAGIGNPIFGDLKYGKEGLILKGKGLFLHASCLNFSHPITGEQISVNVSLPKKFKKLFPEM